MSGAHKGSAFERHICKELSLWWTAGESDAIFWRSSQSGGRATQRAKSGKVTPNSYGDIAALDPIGEPLLKFATFELKRGSTQGTPWDIFESAPSDAVRPFEHALLQARSSSVDAGSLGWALIVKRDRKEAIIYLDSASHRRLGVEWNVPSVRFKLETSRDHFHFVAVGLKEWLKRVSPDVIKACLTAGQSWRQCI